MKDMKASGINRYRVRRGPMGSDDSIGNYGMFVIPLSSSHSAIVIVSDGDETGWEHVSVHVKYKTSKGRIKERTPHWDEMSRIKDLFWEPEETVVQFHPPKSQYINNHEHCLHLWRPEDDHIQLPPVSLVGIPTLTTSSEDKI